MSWFKLKAQPKDERPPLQGYGEEMDPPQGGSVIARLPISPLTGEPYDPELIIRWPPHPSVDRRLIGTDY